ncbi:MAG: tetratricopeptide repeat protein [Verrucomicrobiota bacterium]
MLEDYEKTLLAAQGYCELGMFEDSLDELQTLPEEARRHPTVLELRVVILIQAKRWKTALSASRELCRIDPRRPTGYIHAAYCLHELDRTEDARDFLLNGPDTLHSEPTFHYNLACYECRLGHLELARIHLDRSIELDKHFKDFAKTDPDLARLRE